MAAQGGRSWELGAKSSERLKRARYSLLVSWHPPIKTAGDEADCAKQHVRVIITGHIVLPGEAHSDGETDQKQTRSSTPGQTKKVTTVLRNVIAIAILTINGKGGVVGGFLTDCWKAESPIIFCL